MFINKLLGKTTYSFLRKTLTVGCMTTRVGAEQQFDFFCLKKQQKM